MVLGVIGVWWLVVCEGECEDLVGGLVVGLIGGCVGV